MVAILAGKEAWGWGVTCEKEILEVKQSREERERAGGRKMDLLRRKPARWQD